MLHQLGPPLKFVPFLAGGLILLWLLFLILKTRYLKENPVLLAVLLFLVILAPVTASVRMLHGIHQAFASRYIIYSLTILSVVFLISLEIIPARFKRFFWLTATVLILIYSLSTSSLSIRGIGTEAGERLEAIQAWAAGNRTVRLSHPYPEVASNIMDESLSRSIYRPPKP
jgi:hypothetical protein